MQASLTAFAQKRDAMAGFRSLVQFVAILLIGLVAGSIFGIWRGYNPDDYSALTFLEMHQDAVHGLNILLPVSSSAGKVGRDPRLCTIRTEPARSILSRFRPIRPQMLSTIASWLSHQL